MASKRLGPVAGQPSAASYRDGQGQPTGRFVAETAAACGRSIADGTFGTGSRDKVLADWEAFFYVGANRDGLPGWMPVPALSELPGGQLAVSANGATAAWPAGTGKDRLRGEALRIREERLGMIGFTGGRSGGSGPDGPGY